MAWWRRRSYKDFDAEVAAHIDLEMDRLIADGIAPDEARAAATRRFGNRASAKERFYDSGRVLWFDRLQLDVRYAARGLARTPTFTCVAVLTIALGIGLNTGIFAVLNGMFLRTLPVPQSSQLVKIHQNIVQNATAPRSSHGDRSYFSTLEYETYRDTSRTLSLAAFVPLTTATLGGETPEPVIGEMVSCNYFEVLALPPVLGFGFEESDCAPGAPPTVILGHNLWTNRFEADPAIIGESVILNRENFRVVGVAPENYRGAEVFDASFWAPIRMQPILDPGDFYDSTNVSWLALIGRRAAEIGLDAVQADVDVIAAQIDRLEPGRETQVSARTATFAAFPEIRATLLSVASIVMVAFGLVLLIACANVANLLLARASGRRKEIAVRLSLGATRSRLLQQLLTESLLIAAVGGAVGSVLAVLAVPNLVAVTFPGLPAGLFFNVDVSPDQRVAQYGLGITFLTAILFGWVPALQASKPDLVSGLKEGGGGSGRRVGWLRSGLVGVQVSVSMVLMIAASLLVLGLYAANTVEPGFGYDGVVVVSTSLEGSGYSVPDGVTFQAQLTEQIRSLPGVDRTAQASITPLGTSRRSSGVWLQGQENPQPVFLTDISPGYFDLLEIPIVLGRDFTAAEISDARASVIVTQSTATRFWPGEDPLTKSFELPGGPGGRRLLQVVGVAQDAQVVSIGEDDTSFIYLPMRPVNQRDSSILLRTSSEFAATAAAIRERARELDAGLVVNVNRLEDNLNTARSLSMLATVLSGTMGALALLVTLIGVYGVVAYTTGMRLREVGIRRMLGAVGRDVMSLLLRQGMIPVLIGGAVGVLISLAVSRILSGALFGVSPFHPAAFVVVPLFLLSATVLASVVPVRRALAADPLVTLRHD